jgi:manganese/zinc/iron transport system substrate-binding protein
VAATTSLIADMVESVGAGHVRVMPLMEAGVDPHATRPSKVAERNLSQAKVTFSNGLLLESGMSALLDRHKQKGGVVLELASAINEANRKKLGDGRYDPHIWGDPRLWALCVSVVVKGLCEADPANAADYTRRGMEVKTQYLALFDWCQQRTGQIPPEARALVTSHDRFNYFADAFGFKVATEAEAVQFIKANGVKALFTESTIPPGAMERISNESGVKIGGQLFSDSPGKRGELKDIGGEKVDQGTYAGMLKSNVHTIVEALK